MFNFMLKNKRGFTLVELLIVVALLGFGVVALANLFQSALRTFNKTEERYIKQEMVKSVAEYLQTSVSIGAATMAEIYDDVAVVPTGESIDSSYSYVYIQKDDKNDGYYLYKLERGQTRDKEVCINPDVPVYISFNVYEEADPNEPDIIVNQCGIKVRICAVDNDFEYKDSYTNAEGEVITEAEAIENYIFYDTIVSYHFPNMVSSANDVRVNLLKAAQGDLSAGNTTTDGENTQGEGSSGATTTHTTQSPTAPLEDVGYNRCVANKYGSEGTVSSVDQNGKVLRITIDTAISADGAAAAVSVSSFCFIATAGFGEATGEVGILCDFRDQCLKTNPLGRMFVKAYYTVSPPIADFIAEHETLKAATRVALKPLVAVAVYALEPELLIDQIPFLIMGLGSLGGIVAVTIVGVRRRKLKVEN